jgi:ABC-type antimicrobial peptide transport system permease subunit
VGVVGNMHDDGMNKDAPTIAYWPILMSHFESRDDDKDDNVRRYVAYAIRTSRAGSESLMKDVRQAVWSVDANLPLSDVHTEEYFYSKSMARTSFTLVMLGVASSIALLLGIVGLYGVIAYSASQRRREIGIRIALGAQRNDITGMFVRQGLLLAGSGVVCGLLVAAGATRLLRSLLFHVSPWTRLTYGVRGSCAVRGGGVGQLFAVAANGLGESGGGAARRVRKAGIWEQVPGSGAKAPSPLRLRPSVNKSQRRFVLSQV